MDTYSGTSDKESLSTSVAAVGFCIIVWRNFVLSEVNHTYFNLGHTHLKQACTMYCNKDSIYECVAGLPIYK